MKKKTHVPGLLDDLGTVASGPLEPVAPAAPPPPPRPPADMDPAPVVPHPMMPVPSAIAHPMVPTPPVDVAPKASVPNPDQPMPPTALVFLEDPIARRLASAWPLCDGTEKDWLEAAGIPIGQFDVARRAMVALKRNRICRDGGVTDTLAMQYLAAIAAEPINKLKRQGQGRSNEPNKNR